METVTIQFRNTIPQNFSGPGSFGLDAVSLDIVQGVPEPTTWAMMLLGFGGIGMAVRRRREKTLLQSGVTQHH